MNPGPRSLDLIARYGTNALTRISDVTDLSIHPRRLGHRISRHTGGITGVALSRDERRVYATTVSGRLVEYNRATGEGRELWHHEAPLTAVAVGTDVIVAGSTDGTVRVFCSSGHALKTLSHGDAVTCLDINHEGTLLVSGGADGSVDVRQLDTGKPLAGFRKHPAGVNAVCFTDDGRVASAGVDGIWLLEPRTGTVVLRLVIDALATPDLSVQHVVTGELGHAVAVLSLDSRAGSLVAGCSDGARLFALTSGECKRTFTNCLGEVLSVALSPDGRTLATGQADFSVTVWNVGSGQMTGKLTGHDDWPVDLAYSDGGTLFSGSLDGTCREWKAGSGGGICTTVFQGETAAVQTVALHENKLAVGGYDDAVSIYDLSTGRRTQTCRGHRAPVLHAAFSPSGRSLVSTSRDNDAILWSTESGALVRRLCVHDGWVSHAAFSADGRRLVTSAHDGTVAVWDTSRGKRLHLWAPVFYEPIAAVEFLDRGQVLAAVRNGEVLRLRGPRGEVSASCDDEEQAGLGAMAVSGAYVLTGGLDGKVRVFSLRTAELLREFRAHEGPVASMLTFEDVVVTGGADSAVKLWSLAGKSDEPLHVLTAHTDTVTAVQRTSDGRLITGSRDGTVRVFSVGPEPKLLATLHSLREGGVLWTTPPELKASSGWFWTDREDLIEVIECEEDGSHPTPLARDDPRRKAYLIAHNNAPKVLASIRGEKFQFDDTPLLAAGPTRLLAGPTGAEDPAEN